MKMVIEILISFMMIVISYVSTYCYLNGKNIKEINIAELRPVSINRKLYLVIACFAYVFLIYTFQSFYKNGLLLHQLKLLILVGGMQALAYIDYKVQKIPNKFLLGMLIIRVFIYILELIFYPSSFMSSFISDVIGCVIIGGFFLVLLIAFKNSIGMGDIKLFALMGLYQGLWGVINSVFFSLIASFIVSVFLLLLKKKTRKDVIPFGPSIFIGTVIAIGLSGM